MTQRPTVSDAEGEAAGFGVRVAASLIDTIILSIPQAVVRRLLGPGLGRLVGVGLAMAYSVYFWTNSGATPGKMVMGLKVVSADTGGLIDVRAAILRYLGYILSIISLGVGFLSVVWDPDKQGWHDKIAKTRVIRAR